MSDRGRDLDMFISSWNKPISPTTESRLRTKCAHIFQYESGTLIQKNPKHSDYLKALEFVRKNFKTASNNFRKKRKIGDVEFWTSIERRIDSAGSAEDLYSVLKTISNS
jgi:hypothetical protein